MIDKDLGRELFWLALALLFVGVLLGFSVGALVFGR